MAPSHLPACCPVCNSDSSCQVDKISQCHCSKTKLAPTTIQFLKSEFAGCLCPICLISVSRIKIDNQRKEMIMLDIEKLRTLTMYEMVFPTQSNHYGTLFGGEALSLMDKAAFIVASRFTRRNVVTASSDKTDFRSPIKTGQLVEIVAEVVEVKRTSLRVSVDLYGEDLRTGDRTLCTSGHFSMVALDDFGKPTPISKTQDPSSSR